MHLEVPLEARYVAKKREKEARRVCTRKHFKLLTCCHLKATRDLKMGHWYLEMAKRQAATPPGTWKVKPARRLLAAGNKTQNAPVQSP